MEKRRITTDEYLALLNERPSKLRQKLDDILISVSWRDFAAKYMNQKGSWLYHKIDGFDGNGEAINPMNGEELTKLRNGLLDLSERIRKVAESL